MKSQHLQDSTFFMLTPGVRDRLMETNLTAAEWRMWCYLVSLDPFGDRGAKFSPAELMLKCQIKKTTYFSAKAKFQKLGLFDFRDGVTKVVNLQTSLVQTASEHPRPAKIIDSEISESQSEISESQSEISESQSEISESQSEISDIQSLKPNPHKVSKPPQTLQTYSDFKDSLSESEREKFFNFVKEKTNNLERPINDLEAWLASKNAAKQNRWEIYYKNFQEEKKYEKFKTTKQNQGSENYDPQKLQDVIKRFQNRGRTDASEPKNEVENETKEIDREEIKRQQAEINRLMDNPPEYETRKSPAQQRRDAIAEAKRKQEEWNLERKRLDAERQRQQELDEPDPEARKAKMIRETEEFLRNRQQQQQNPEIGEEDRDYE